MTAELNLICEKERNGSSDGQLVTSIDTGRHPPIFARRGPQTRIAVRAEKKFLFIDVAEIMAIEACGNYVILRRKYERHILRQSISILAEKLEGLGFVRIHRSLIVNSLFAKEVQALPSGDYLLQLEGGSQYTVTRTYRNNLRLLAGLWLGPQFGDLSV